MSWEVPESSGNPRLRELSSTSLGRPVKTHSNLLHPRAAARAAPESILQLFPALLQNPARQNSFPFSPCLPPAHTAGPGHLPMQPLLCWEMEAPANEAVCRGVTMPLDRHGLPSGSGRICPRRRLPFGGRNSGSLAFASQFPSHPPRSSRKTICILFVA